MYYILLLAIITVCIYTVIRDRQEYEAFKKTKNPKRRLAFYKSWLIKSYILIGLPAIIVLFALQKTSYVFQPIWSNESTRLMQAEISNQSVISTAAGFTIGVIVGILLLGSVTFIKTRWARKISTGTVGDIQALLPRNSKERKYGFLLAISAGFNEELLFRVAVPVVLIGILPDSKTAIILSIVAFGLMHIYQGVAGVIGATLAGGMLMSLYIITGNIFTSMFIHAFIDMNALVIQPLIARYALRK